MQAVSASVGTLEVMQHTNCHAPFWSECSIQLSFVSKCFNPKLQGGLWKLSPLQAVSKAYDFWHPSTPITPQGVNSNLRHSHKYIHIFTKITCISCKVVCLGKPFLRAKFYGPSMLLKGLGQPKLPKGTPGEKEVVDVLQTRENLAVEKTCVPTFNF